MEVKEKIKQIVDFVMDLDMLTRIDTDEREYIETAVIEGFKAGEGKGKEEGREEVVDWVEEHLLIRRYEVDPTYQVLVNKWQAFLKER